MAEIVDLKASQCTWVPVDDNVTVEVGTIVGCGTDHDTTSGTGVRSISAAAGVADITGLEVPYGVVIGINDITQSNNTTADEIPTPQITGVITQATQVARSWFGQEGMWNKGDPQALVQVGLVDATTRIKMPLYNAAWGTAPTLLTVTTGSTDGAVTGGTAIVTNATDVASVQEHGIAYCRTGANAGLYRIVNTASDTTHTFKVPFPYDIAVGDTFVIVPCRVGLGRMQTDALASYINVAAAGATAYYEVFYDHLDLREAGKEYAIIRFSSAHFTANRAVHA